MSKHFTSLWLIKGKSLYVISKSAIVNTDPFFWKILVFKNLIII